MLTFSFFFAAQQQANQRRAPRQLGVCATAAAGAAVRGRRSRGAAENLFVGLMIVIKEHFALLLFSFFITTVLPTFLKMKWRHLCNITAILQGVWQFIEKPSREMVETMIDPWKYCPKTKQQVLESRSSSKNWNDLSYQVERYSCYNHTYQYAVFVPHRCDLSSVKESLETIKKRDFHHNMAQQYSSPPHQNQHHILSPQSRMLVENNMKFSSSDNHRGLIDEAFHLHVPRHRIVYIGDSLSAQMYIAGKCLIEELGFEKYFNLTLVYPKNFLRPGLPCADECINHPELFTVHKQFTCSACPNGKRVELNVTAIYNSWYTRIANDTLAVLIGAGSWYNWYKGVANSDAEYEETMKIISPMIYNLIYHRNILVFWLGLPPNGNETVMGDFEWSRYRSKDEIAKTYLEPLGIIFLDNVALVGERKRSDINLNPGKNDIHWW